MSGNLIYSQSFITVADDAITARTSASGYDKVDIMDYWHLKARHRATDLTASDTSTLFRIDLTTASQAVAGVYLSDVNYDKVRIYGHATDIGAGSWAGATWPTSKADITLSQNPWTGRYQGYIPTSGFAYRWMGIIVPAAATAVGSYTTTWETGVVCIMSSVTTLSINLGYPLRQSTNHPFTDTGRSGRISLGDVVQWVGEISFGVRSRTDEAEAQAFGRLSASTPVFVYLNQDNTSEAYLCLRDQGYSSEWFTASLVQSAQGIQLKELVGV